LFFTKDRGLRFDLDLDLDHSISTTTTTTTTTTTSIKVEEDEQIQKVFFVLLKLHPNHQNLHTTRNQTKNKHYLSLLLSFPFCCCDA
jgi:hypothetical protein